MNIRAFIGAFWDVGGTFLRSRWSFLIIETRLFKIKITFSRYRPPFLTIDVLFTTHFLKIRVIFWFLRTLFNDWWLLSISRLGFLKIDFCWRSFIFWWAFYFFDHSFTFLRSTPHIQTQDQRFSQPLTFHSTSLSRKLKKKAQDPKLYYI